MFQVFTTKVPVRYPLACCLMWPTICVLLLVPHDSFLCYCNSYFSIVFPLKVIAVLLIISMASVFILFTLGCVLICFNIFLLPDTPLFNVACCFYKIEIIFSDFTIYWSILFLEVVNVLLSCVGWSIYVFCVCNTCVIVFITQPI